MEEEPLSAVETPPVETNPETEKRKHVRYRVNVRVAIRLSDGDVAWAQSVDLSLGGIYVEYPASTDVGRTFEMMFDLPLKKEFKRVFVKASVVRVNIIGDKDVFGIAFIFNEFAKDTKTVLEDYIRIREQYRLAGH